MLFFSLQSSGHFFSSQVSIGTRAIVRSSTVSLLQFSCQIVLHRPGPAMVPLTPCRSITIMKYDYDEIICMGLDAVMRYLHINFYKK